MELMKANALDLGWSHRGLTEVVVGADRGRDDMHLVAMTAISLQGLVQRRRASLSREGPHIKRRDQEDAHNPPPAPLKPALTVEGQRREGVRSLNNRTLSH